MTDFEILFNNLNFNDKKIRDKILGKFFNAIEMFRKKNKITANNNITDIYLQYILKYKRPFTINNFIFKNDLSGILLMNKSNPKFCIIFQFLKSVTFIDDKKIQSEEWIISINYLKYLLDYIYKFKYPKFALSIDLMNSDDSVLSINENNIFEFFENDWNVIYEGTKTIDYEKIKKYKYIPHYNDSKRTDKYFYKLAGIEVNQDELNYSSSSLSLSILFEKLNSLHDKIVIFHNKDKFFRLNFLKQFDNLYNVKNIGYMYINFELLKNIKSRKERLEYFAYCLLSLFPCDYTYFQEFFEDEVKNLLSEQESCLDLIIDAIMNYFEKNFFNKENYINTDVKQIKSKSNFSGINMPYDKQLYCKTHYIIFDNIVDYKYKNLIDSIIYKKDSNSHFKFIMIFPLINKYVFETFLDYIPEREELINSSLYFVNLNNINSGRQQQSNENNQNIKVFNEDINNEEMIYDLIRIYNFNEIFITSRNYEINNQSINFLLKYLFCFNIEFDNDKRKILNIHFKNQSIKKIFDNKYQDVLNFIKLKTNENIFKDIAGQSDAYDLEKIIINTILNNNKKNYKTLELHSIFGLKDVKKEPKINYENCGFYLKQKSLGAEVFDFGIKIKTPTNKQYLKVIQETFDKTEPEREKIIKEKIIIYSSFIKNKFKEKELGALSDISFIIISPTRILDKKDNYKKIKKFCKENGYELILFNLNDRTFYKRKKGKNIPYNDNDWYSIDNNYLLKVPDFNDIININKNVKMLSSRNVKERDEFAEDLNSKSIAKKYIKNEIHRISKLEYYGNFSDLIKLHTDYFAYLYDKDNHYTYFFDKKIVKSNLTDENSKIRKINIILYTFKGKVNAYIDSSPEIEVTKKKQNLLKSKKSIDGQKEKIITKNIIPIKENLFITKENKDEKREKISTKKNIHKIEELLKTKETKIKNFPTKAKKNENINDDYFYKEDEKKVIIINKNNTTQPKKGSKDNPFCEKISIENTHLIRKRKRHKKNNSKQKK